VRALHTDNTTKSCEEVQNILKTLGSSISLAQIAAKSEMSGDGLSSMQSQYDALWKEVKEEEEKHQENHNTELELEFSILHKLLILALIKRADTEIERKGFGSDSAAGGGGGRGEVGSGRGGGGSFGMQEKESGENSSGNAAEVELWRYSDMMHRNVWPALETIGCMRECAEGKTLLAWVARKEPIAQERDHRIFSRGCVEKSLPSFEA